MSNRPVPKCQNRPGKTCIAYKNKNWYYTNEKDLAKQLNVREAVAKKLIDEGTKRILLNKNNELDVIDIANYDRALLQRHFGISRISNTNLINGVERKNGTVLAKQIGENELINGVHVHIKISISSPSIPISQRQILTKEGKSKFDRYLKDPNFIIPNKDMLKYINKDKYDDYVNTKKWIFIREKDMVVSGDVSDISLRAESLVQKYMSEFNGGFTMLVYFMDVVGKYTKKEATYNESYIADIQQIYQLEEWANIEYNFNKKSKDSCCVQFVSNRYPQHYWALKNKETIHGVLMQDFIDICEKNDMPYDLYDINGKELKSKYDKLNDKNTILRAIVYNNHIYPVEGGKKPKRVALVPKKVILIEDGVTNLTDTLDKQILPKNIKISFKRNGLSDDAKTSMNVVSYCVKDTKFIANPEYNKCKIILDNMGYSKYITDDISIVDIPYILEKATCTKKAVSFFPEKHMFKTAPYYYKTRENIDNIENIITQDKNKAYSCALYNLDFLITFDYRTCAINENPIDIIDSNLYWCVPKYSSLQMPETGLYEGYHLKQCKECNIDFEMKEELECEILPNYFRNIIDLMYKHMNQNDFKNAMNIMIGKFEKEFGIKYTCKFDGVYNKKSASLHDGFTHKLGKHTLFYNGHESYEGIRDNLPISIQIKNKSRMIIADRIKECEIEESKILYINTDSISYYGDSLKKKLDPNDLQGWKKATVDFNKIGNPSEMVDNRSSYSCINLTNENPNPRILHNQYAGAGKTTYIINELVPKLISQGISYIVLTPSHETLKEFKDKNINCQIIQHYHFVDKGVPKEDYIIIDEIGFLDSTGHDILYKINMAKKSFECFGDFKQLKSIDGKVYNKWHYLEYMFNEIDDSYVNYRNKFTTKYYDKLRYEQVDIKKEVKKWSKKNYTNAELMICYRHKTKNEYNLLMLKELGLNPTSKSVKLISKNNKLKDIGIYNHKRMTIHNKYTDKYDIKHCILIDEENNEFDIELKQLKHFDFAYCLNIHQVQGRTLKSYYWCDEDDKFLDGRTAYTIISRLKQ